MHNRRLRLGDAVESVILTMGLVMTTASVGGTGVCYVPASGTEGAFMLRRVATLAAFGVALSAPASAGVLLTYPTPGSGDVVYSPMSLARSGSVDGFDWIEAARLAPRVAPRGADGYPAEPAWAAYFLDPSLGISVDVWLTAANGADATIDGPGALVAGDGNGGTDLAPQPARCGTAERYCAGAE